MNSRLQIITDTIVWTLSSAFLLLLLASAADAATPAAAQPGADAAWREECGSCHIPFPARLLPADSWQALLGSLDKHFGVDASLDPARTAEVGRYLRSHAERAAAPPSARPALRITALPWFVREHDEVAPSVWVRPAVRSRANCGACHAGAERGQFDEDSVRTPQ